jgi:hypothetical protein
LADNSSRWRWLRIVLAGLAVGMAVTEGADVGALFSLLVAVVVIYQSCVAGGPPVKAVATGLGRLTLIAVCAALLAAQAIAGLLATNIKGIAGTQQDAQTKAQRWDWATQWSLPKRETLNLVIPGLFGYRMDTPEGGVYWGAVGRDPAWDRYFESVESGQQAPQQPAGPLRYTGGGNYAGILVALVAVWAALQALRKKDSVFSPDTRRRIWFWIGVVAIALPLAWGRFAPFYRLLYALPYFSTIRNPAKFLHPLSWALVVLFAYGIDGLWRRYLQAPAGGAAGLRAWWQRVRGFDRRWTLGSLAVFGASLLAGLIYVSSRDGLERYLQQVGFEPAMAQSIVGFSFGQVGWFLLFFGAALALLTLVLSGAFSGRRAQWGGVLLGLFLVADLGRANQPWIITWNYKQKYASNPIIDALRNKPYEHRVAVLPRWLQDPALHQAFNLSQQQARQLAGAEQYIGQLYGIEWAQHHFLYYNVQSLDLIQMPRMPEDLAAFETVLAPRTGADFSRVVGRRWQLTNTRYFIGATGFLDFLNQVIDPSQHRFRIVQTFNIEPKPGIANPTKLEELTAVPATNAPFALFEFTGALPRAKLYSNWQVTTNDQAALEKLASPAFEPEKSVLVAGSVPAPSGGTNSEAGTVSFESYAPKDLLLKAQAAAPAVLLLNDHYDSNWKVLVDAKPAALLRCNYLMRGVFLQPGAHTIEFRFEPPLRGFYVSLSAIGLGLLLIGLLLVVKDPPPAPGAPPSKPSLTQTGRAKT